MKRGFLVLAAVAARALGGAAAFACGMPGGSWHQTCSRASMPGRVLSASCRTGTGRLSCGG